MLSLQFGGVQYYHQVLGKVHLKVSNRQCLPHLSPQALTFS